MGNIVTWDAVGERYYETGLDRGVLYVPTAGVYDTGFAWNGLVSVSESASGGEATPFYADNIKYLNLNSLEEFEASIEAMTYPPEFEQFDGLTALQPGVLIGQQYRNLFGLSYRTRIGSDTNEDFGYKLHLIYGAQVSPTEKGYMSLSDTPEPIMFSWDMTTTPVAVTGYKPTASVTIDSRTVNSVDLAALEVILYGDNDEANAGANPVEPRLPLPDEIATLFAP